MSAPPPVVGDWYRTPTGNYLEVVAYDADEQAVEVQFFDGTVEEYDLDSWDEMELRTAEPPEDWSGSLDVKGEDYGVDLDRPAGDHRGNPLEELDSHDDGELD